MAPPAVFHATNTVHLIYSLSRKWTQYANKLTWVFTFSWIQVTLFPQVTLPVNGKKRIDFEGVKDAKYLREPEAKRNREREWEWEWEREKKRGEQERTFLFEITSSLLSNLHSFVPGTGIKA